jgi:hypothetical protein
MTMRFAVTATLLALCGAAAFAQPRLQVVEGTKFDFGDLNKGAIAERKLTIKNPGADTLVISRVDASCGCTGAMLSDQRIAPGDAGTLMITFNSKNFSGPIHKTVTIHSNTFEGTTTVVEFTANVVEEVSLDPTALWFRDAQVGVTSTATLLVKNQGKVPLKLTALKTQLEGFTLTLPDAPIAPGASARLVAEYKPKTARPVLSDGVFITTSSTAQPQLYVQIYGNVKEFKFE